MSQNVTREMRIDHQSNAIRLHTDNVLKRENRPKAHRKHTIITPFMIDNNNTGFPGPYYDIHRRSYNEPAQDAALN
jgi:hypothetical protein